MCGRVVRSKEDVGDTYIIDPQFLSFFDNQRGGTSLATEMPKYVVESIENYRGCSE
jgi:Rad3-related DNA helicase